MSLVLGSCMLVGYLGFLLHPIVTEQAHIVVGTHVEVRGQIDQMRDTTYGVYVDIKNVTLTKENQDIELHSHLSLYFKERPNCTENDWIEVSGKIKAPSLQMNPSDMDYTSYQLANQLIGTIEVLAIDNLIEKTTVIEYLQQYLLNKIELLYGQRDSGIMPTILLGNDTLLIDEISTLYTTTGIGHVLCLSGFHVAVVISSLLVILRQFKINYTKRYIVLLVGIWFFALLTGLSLSTKRAVIMMSVLIIGRIILEEEDLLTNISVAALLILILSPYQLFQPGFQLSFAAVISLNIVNELLKHLKASGNSNKLLELVAPCMGVQLGIAPILAYHFFEIPFLATFLNIIIIPIYSILLIGGWSSVLCAIICMPVAKGIATIVLWILSIINPCVERISTIPLATVCTGRPSVIFFILIAIGMILVIGYCYKLSPKKHYYYTWLGSMIVYLLLSFTLPKNLNTMFLYVGQGDSAVMITPTKQTIVVDGGQSGKGAVIERYLKYTGNPQIDLMIVSHSDFDHIGGLIDLLDANIPIGQVLISKLDDSPLLNQFLDKCTLRQIPVYRAGTGDEIKVGELAIKCIAPSGRLLTTDANNSSLVCKAVYKDFSVLFTGDQHKEFESYLYEGTAPVTILKVSHHGSKTGTSDYLLDVITPQVAVISCGVNNRYSHPHQEVLTLLTNRAIPYIQTNLKGAIHISTNGKVAKVSSFYK